MSNQNAAECCPEFKRESWDGKEIHWQDKRFLKDHVRSVFHIPLNFGKVMARDMAQIEAAGAASEERLVLSDENSLWGSDVFVETSKDVPGAEMAFITGDYLSKVFEGPYSKMQSFVSQMKAYVQAQGKKIEKMYFYYPYCPDCAKKYGKNYVGILAQV